MNLKEQQTQIQADHRKRLEELNELRERGDIKRVADITGLTQQYAAQALNRIGSKHHLTVVNALERVIKERLESYDHSKA